MKQGIQSTLGHAKIKKDGCYFLSILRWVEIEQNKSFDETEIENIYYEAVRLGFMEPDCFVQNAPEVYRLASGARPYREMKPVKDKPKDDTFIICQSKPGYTHFVLSHKGETWDSLDPKRQGAAAYKPDSYRVFV